MAAWAWAVRCRAGPLAVDRHVSAWLAVGKHAQDEGIRLLTVEGPVEVAAGAAVLALVALGLRSGRSAVAILVGVAAEIASVQWVIKPLVDRHELAPDPAFPSSHVGALVAGVTAAVLLVRPGGPVDEALSPGTAALLRSVVLVVGGVDAVVVSVATIATGGHLFSDVIAVIPWAIAVPWAAFAVLAPPRAPASRSW